MHKDFKGEVLYTIEEVMPTDLNKGKTEKNKDLESVEAGTPASVSHLSLRCNNTNK